MNERELASVCEGSHIEGFTRRELRLLELATWRLRHYPYAATTGLQKKDVKELEALVGKLRTMIAAAPAVDGEKL